MVIADMQLRGVSFHVLVCRGFVTACMSPAVSLAVWVRVRVWGAPSKVLRCIWGLCLLALPARCLPIHRQQLGLLLLLLLLLPPLPLSWGFLCVFLLHRPPYTTKDTCCTTAHIINSYIIFEKLGLDRYGTCLHPFLCSIVLLPCREWIEKQEAKAAQAAQVGHHHCIHFMPAVPCTAGTAAVHAPPAALVAGYKKKSDGGAACAIVVVSP